MARHGTEARWGRSLLRARHAACLQGAILGRDKVGLKFNCPSNKLAEVSASLPSEQSPTVSQVGWG